MVEIRTSCKDCVFRINDDNGKQTDCKLGRLEKFNNRGVVSREDDYFMINAFCATCRNEEYTEEEVLKDVEIKCSMIVDGTVDFWPTLKSILKQKIKPRDVFVVFCSAKNFDREKYLEYQEVFRDNEINLVFKRFFQENTFEDMLDEALRFCRTQFYIPVNKPIDPNLIYNYNQMINYEMLQINAYLYQDYFNSLISIFLHRKLFGNNKIPLVEKLVELYDSLGDDLKQKETIKFHEHYRDNSTQKL